MFLLASSVALGYEITKCGLSKRIKVLRVKCGFKPGFEVVSRRASWSTGSGDALALACEMAGFPKTQDVFFYISEIEGVTLFKLAHNFRNTEILKIYKVDGPYFCSLMKCAHLLKWTVMFTNDLHLQDQERFLRALRHFEIDGATLSVIGEQRKIYTTLVDSIDHRFFNDHPDRICIKMALRDALIEV